MHYVFLFILSIIPYDSLAELIIPEPNIVIAPYDITPEDHSTFRYLTQFNGTLTDYDIKVGFVIAPKFKNIYEKNIGYIGLSQRRAKHYTLWRLGVFIDSYQSYKNEAQGNIKTRLNLYLRQHNNDEDIGIGLGAHTLFQLKRNLFYSVGFEARPVFLTFDWSDETYFELDIQQEFRAFFTSNISLYTRWMFVNQFEGSAALTLPINRLSFGFTIQR
ncbi:MAG: hypothetical protein HRU38_03575 [Saccharospirillaceae bacterium]|nr:hypothetical protein [Pseudomonadales bacterium]NRB77743.1 hypothetical protein [Saccharospirillaceae bacterium]